ncbi:MAG: hypothetical protein FRX48_08388 [Lasallia pustulata]|uniref:Uncharacterized protein n=1 Tax=Lasallia pustulata TaxID=136370 RepID=A0A5M8PFF2_9LECA|nr:MAG: hypothetical protein FRX48_08388 [Lasallia pustulata]
MPLLSITSRIQPRTNEPILTAFTPGGAAPGGAADCASSGVPPHIRSWFPPVNRATIFPISRRYPLSHEKSQAFRKYDMVLKGLDTSWRFR